MKERNMNISPYAIISVIALVLYGGSRVLTYENNRPTEVSAPAAGAPLNVASYIVDLTIPEVGLPPKRLCALKNDTQEVKDIPCGLTEERPSDDAVNLTFNIHGSLFTFYGTYAPEGGIEITSASYNDFAPEQVFGFCEVGDGEAACEVTNGTSIMRISSYYDRPMGY